MNGGALSRRRLLAGTGIALVGAVVGGASAVGGTTASAADRLSPAAVPAGRRTVGKAAVALTQPTDPYVGTVAATADADSIGMFAPLMDWPVLPLSAVLQPDGRLLTFGTPVGVSVQNGMTFDVWDAAADPRNSHVQTTTMHHYDSFCNGVQTLPDGRFVMVGGNSYTTTMLYDPATGAQQEAANLAQPRWYPGVLRLTDDRILVVGGGTQNATAYWTPWDNSTVALTPEIGSGDGPWRQLNGATSTFAFGADQNRWWYPRVYNAPDGSVFGISGDRLWTMSVDGDGRLDDRGRLPITMGVSGTTVMIEPGRIAVIGGGSIMNADYQTATTACTIVDIRGANVSVQPTTPSHFGRNWLDAAILPNGEVVVTGGTTVGVQGDTAVYATEIFDPSTSEWRIAASGTKIRTYHSTSALLPSGAVFTGGGGIPGPETNFDAELFYPPSMFTRDASGSVIWADRPVITAISGDARWDGTIDLSTSDERPLESVTLITSPNVTHSQNVDQRRVPLRFTRSGKTVSAVMPTRADLPPGTYLLQVTDAAGVSSPSQILTVYTDGPGVITVFGEAPPPAAAQPMHHMS